MTCQGPARTSVRTLFLSDLHVGCKHAQTSLALDVLNTYQADRLYLIGDVIDGRRLTRRWYWEPAYVDFFCRVSELIQTGCDVFYTPGNHDDFLRKSDVRRVLRSLRDVHIHDAFVHELADGRRFLITHGDLFDPVERRSLWLSRLGSVLYEVLLNVDMAYVRVLRRQVRQSFPISTAVKRGTKWFLSSLSRFQSSLLQEAAANDCDGVVCGHVHTPALEECGTMIYCNTGDWIGSCTFIIERNDGRLDLLAYRDGGRGRIVKTMRRAAVSPLPVEEELQGCEVFGHSRAPRV